MIIEKIKETGDSLKMLEGHDRLQYLVDKAQRGRTFTSISQNRIK